jgi:hypothetical protein
MRFFIECDDGAAWYLTAPTVSAALRVLDLYAEAHKVDDAIMCKAEYWRARDGITEPIWFKGGLLSWEIEHETLRINVGGAVGRYLPPLEPKA